MHPVKEFHTNLPEGLTHHVLPSMLPILRSKALTSDTQTVKLSDH